MTVDKEIKQLEETIGELKRRFCENCQEWDCDCCRWERKKAKWMTREEAKLYIIRHCNPDYPNGSTEWETAMNMAIKALQQPEIIRCEDCKHRYVDGENVRFNVCELNHNKVQSDDWFCADAERKEGEA